MSDPEQLLTQDAYGVIFLSVFAEQVGLPLPTAPVLIAAGTLSAAGRISLAWAVSISVVASVLADSLWYALGRRYGTRVLGFLCRLSIEPDTCVRHNLDGFARHGPWLLTISKFVPGLNTVAPPLAGAARIGLLRFLLLDAAGMLALALVLMGAGYSLSGPFGRLGRWLAAEGGWTALAIVAAVLAYLGWKYARRRRVLRQLRVARVTADDLKAKIDAGDPVVIVDLRHPLELVGAPQGLPGAIHMQLEEIDERYQEIPRDRDVVLYCA